MSNACWYHENVVLIGDAAHTAHFSIGSGTKLAMEDAIALARILGEDARLATALPRYQEERKNEALRLQNAARNSMEWFENVRRYVQLDPPQLYLTGKKQLERNLQRRAEMLGTSTI